MTKRVISFDFGGTLAKFSEEENKLVPNLDTVISLREYADIGHEVIVISSGFDDELEDMWDFVNKYELPISDIKVTNGERKGDTIAASNSFMHFDDDFNEIDSLEQSDTRGVLVNA